MGSLTANRFGSVRDDWATPQSLFKPLDDEFHFTLDVCASEGNKKCKRYIDKKRDGLKGSWGKSGTVCWMNPPFGRGMKDWLAKALAQTMRGVTTVCVIPARTNTAWWHDICMKGEIRFVRGRPKFEGAEHGLPFPIAIVIFRPGCREGEQPYKSQRIVA